jgi:hypothetical protein
VLLVLPETTESRLGNAENTCIWIQASRDRSKRTMQSKTQTFNVYSKIYNSIQSTSIFYWKYENIVELNDATMQVQDS